MTLFLTAIRPTGGLVKKADVFGYLARLPRDPVQFQTTTEGAFTAATTVAPAPLRPLSARFRGTIGVGDVRLDNRDEIARLAGLAGTASDLELVLAVLDRRGSAAIRLLEGDFAFVAWDPRAQKVIAARDAFGVKPLFLRRCHDLLVFCSRAAPLAGSSYDTGFLRDFLYGLPTAGARTAWQDVERLEPATFLEQRGTAGRIERYWSPTSYVPAETTDEPAATDEFRRLFVNSIAQRLDGDSTWTLLSGGLDSSAIVSTAETLVRPGAIGGTLTVVETLGNGDEREYVAAVVDAHRVRNVQLENSWPWRDAADLVATDEPYALFPFQHRDRQMQQTVQAAGARVLLSGLGSDHYLSGTMYYIPDLLVKGHLVRATRELVAWSIAIRQSFWTMAGRHAIRPLLHGTRIHTSGNGRALPAWLGTQKQIAADFARLYDFTRGAPRGRLFSYYQSRELQNIACWVMRDGFENGMEVRYPFLSRPLVEFALQLPVHMRIRPQGSKWVLRQAMKGVLPEKVRRRTGKGGIDARILWALQHERAFLTDLLEQPLLAELGLVDANALRQAVEEARCGRPHHAVLLMSALALETWLATREGKLLRYRKAA